MRQAVEETLTEHQRRLFVAVVLNEVPLDALAARLGSNRNAIYKAIFDARRKIHGFLVANGYPEERRPGPVMSTWAALERFLRTDPADVGCEQAMEILHVYVDLVAAEPGRGSPLLGRDRAPGRVRPVLRGLPRAARRSHRRPVCPR